MCTLSKAKAKRAGWGEGAKGGRGGGKEMLPYDERFL